MGDLNDNGLEPQQSGGQRQKIRNSSFHESPGETESQTQLLVRTSQAMASLAALIQTQYQLLKKAKFSLIAFPYCS